MNVRLISSDLCLINSASCKNFFKLLVIHFPVLFIERPNFRIGCIYHQTLAGFGIRFLALLIDIIIGYIFGLLLGLLAGESFADASGFGGSKEVTPLDGLLIGASFALDMIYSTVMLTRYGGTLGKLFTGLRVVRADGTALSWKRSLGRTLACYLSVLTCFTGYMIALFDSERRALHDHICRTRVVRARKISASAAA